MSKNTVTYWNVLAPENQGEWEEIPGSNGMLQQITLAIDEVSADYTKLLIILLDRLVWKKNFSGFLH